MPILMPYNYETYSSLSTLIQFGSEPTHHPDGTLDVIIAGAANKPRDVTVTDGILSDHMMITWSACLSLAAPIYTTKTKRL